MSVEVMSGGGTDVVLYSDLYGYVTCTSYKALQIRLPDNKTSNENTSFSFQVTFYDSKGSVFTIVVWTSKWNAHGKSFRIHYMVFSGEIDIGGGIGNAVLIDYQEISTQGSLFTISGTDAYDFKSIRSSIIGVIVC